MNKTLGVYLAAAKKTILVLAAAFALIATSNLITDHFLEVGVLPNSAANGNRSWQFGQAATLTFLRPAPASSIVAKSQESQSSSSAEKALMNNPRYELNNYGPNVNLPVWKDRQKEAKPSELKSILMWNNAYGRKKYDIGQGRDKFYK